MSKCKIIIWILTAAFMLSACSPAVESPPAATTPTFAPETSIPEIPLPDETEFPVFSWISTSYEETFQWTDGVGSQNAVSIRIPVLNVSGSEAAALNQSIDAYCTEIKDQIIDAQKGAYSTFTAELDYEWFLNEDTLSILLIHDSVLDYTEYTVFNFDLEDSEILTIADMCNEFLDMDYAVFLKMTNDMILRDFRSEYGDYAAANPEDFQFMEDYYTQNLVSLQYRSLYLDQGGNLMLVTDRPAIAGSGLISCIEPMSYDPKLVPAEEDAYRWLFDLSIIVDEDSADAYHTILKLAYDDNEEDFLDSLEKQPQSVIDEIRSVVGWA